jgi:hypothetical protein
MVTQVLKAPTTAPSVLTYLLDGQSLMLITKHAFMLVFKFQEQMQKLCQVNGSIRLVHALVLKLVIKFGFLDI